MNKFGRMLVLVVALLSCSMLTAEEKEKPRPKQWQGVLTKVESASITVTRRGDSGERTTEFMLGNSTTIEAETSDDEVIGKGEGGQDKTRPKRVKITASDLKTGRQVSVTYTQDGKADGILVLRERKKEGKEG
jgi:hypothetical protein